MTDPATAQTRKYRVVPYHEPDGRTTYAVQQIVTADGYYLRHLTSFHETEAEAETEAAWRSICAAMVDPPSTAASSVVERVSAYTGTQP